MYPEGKAHRIIYKQPVSMMTLVAEVGGLFVSIICLSFILTEYLSGTFRKINAVEQFL